MVDAHLELDPSDAVEFVLHSGGTAGADASPRVTLTLRHPDADSGPVAFKVRLCPLYSHCFIGVCACASAAVECGAGGARGL